MEKLTVVRKQEKEKAPFACLKVSVTSANNGRQKTKKKKKEWYPTPYHQEEESKA